MKMDSSPSNRPFEVELEFPVRTYDIDFAGVVSNIVYIRWLEDLRLTVLERYYPLEKLLAAGLAPTLVETHIRYRRPIRISQRVAGRMWASDMTRTRFVLQAEISVNGEVAAVVEQTGCLVDMATGRPAPLPEEFARQFYR